MNPNTYPENNNTVFSSPSPIVRVRRLTLVLPRTTNNTTDFEALSRLYAQYFFFLLAQQQNYPRSPT